MTQEPILFVDDEPNVLSGISRQLRGRYAVTTCHEPLEAAALIERSPPFAVVVSDFRMPKMNGVQFLARVRERCPDSVRMMLTGQADLETAVMAVNEGSIFRLLLKPCPFDGLTAAIDAGLRQYRLLQTERELLERTLRGAIELLSDVLAAISSTAFSRAARVREVASRLAKRLDFENEWEVEVTAMLSQIGCVTVPSGVLERKLSGKTLDEHESQAYLNHPKSGRELLRKIPRLERVAEAVGSQFERQAPTRLARILQVCVAFDDLIVLEKTPLQALQALHQSLLDDPWNILAVLEEDLKSAGDAPKSVVLVDVSSLVVGMQLAADLVDSKGVVLLARGFVITDALRHRLASFARLGMIKESVAVFA